MSVDPVHGFMEGPLVTWIRTFECDGGRSLTYAALADGVFLFDVMCHISRRGDVGRGSRPLNRCPGDPHARLANLSVLLSFIRSFYQEVLNQTLLAPLPDVVKLSKTPETEGGVEELRKLLLLVLGCAVQSPLKEDVVGNIKALPLDTQHDIVQCIQEVTDNPETVWPSEWCLLQGVPEENCSRAFSLLVDHCKRLVAERDRYSKDLLKSLLGDCEEEEAEDCVHHLGVQLADSKAQLRRLRQEYDEKAEAVVELKEELEQIKDTVAKLRQENVDLVQDARSARAWRDEADILRERASRVDALEAEVGRYRDKMADIEFYKTRVEELREDNRILVETKEMLEDQLSTSRRRAEQVLDLENKILQLKQQINHLNMDRDSDRDRLQDLMEENAQLQLRNRNSLSESATLAAQMESLKSKSVSGNGRNIGSDLIGDAKTQVLKLQLENQRLEAEVEELKRENHLASQDKLVELEKENKRLSLKVTHLQETGQKEKAHACDVQQALQVKEKETEKLKDIINTIKANTERQTGELQNENGHLQDLIETLRERQKKNTDDRLNDVEKENKNLMDVNLQLQSQLSRLEYEKQQLTKVTERLRESAETLMEVEHQKAEIERENRDLQKAIVAFKESCEKHERLEEGYISLEVEFARVSRSLDNTKDSLAKLESSHSEKIRLQVEVEKLHRSLDSLKSSSTLIADLEMERDQLLTQTNQLNRQIKALKEDKSKADQLELDILSANTEIQKLQRSLETLQKKLHDSEKEKGEVEAENSKLRRTVETSKLTTKKLNELERDMTEIEGNNDRLDRENKSLKKEVERLRGSLEVKDSLVDEVSSKTSKLERDNKKLVKEVDALKSNDNRVREVEQEKRELEQQILVERRTLSTLREDLVTEKVKNQQLNNQLDSLTSDLEKLGLNADNISSPITDGDNERYKALEAMLEETLKRSVEVREEKITSLESRLSESVSRNQQMRNQLLQVRSEYESLLQRHQEEGTELSLDSTKEIMKIKEALQRSNEEKTSLENEVSALTSQTASYREQVCALQSQVTSLSNQNTVISQHNANLQGERARLQVENSTLQSQSASLHAQNSSLQSSATQLNADKDSVKKSYEERGIRLTQLVNDHEALQKLHEQLAQEYETLTSEHNNLKISHKGLKIEAKLLKDRQENLSANEDELLKLREALEAEMANLKNDSSSLSNLRAEHSRLKDDFRSLFTANDRLRSEYKNLQGDYKAIKTENNSLKLKFTELGGDLNDTRDQIAILDVETTKLTNKCQVLESINLSLEEDRRSLMSQVSLLLTQYHDLLTQTLDDKQHFHQEEKNFTDKLNNLRRQKEKLEEKIMEQYRKMDNSPHKKKGFGSNLVKRVRKAGNDLISKVPRTGRSRSRGRDELDSPDSSSLGSSQANDSLDSGSETRRSSPNLPPSPQNELPNERRCSFGSSVISSHRKSLPPGVGELYITPSVRSSTSSEDVPVYNSIDSNNDTTVKEEETLSVGAGTIELSRVGSRRAVYLAQESDSNSTRDVAQESHNRESIRSRGGTVRSTSSVSLSQNSNRNVVVNGSILSAVSGTPRPTTPGTPTGTPGVAGSIPPRSSTPKTNAVNANPKTNNNPPELKVTPKLPPRNEHNNNNAPKLPPRVARKGSTLTPESSLSSSQSTSANGTPEPRLKSQPPAPNPSTQDMPLKQGPQNKDHVDNSIWYEYGCV